MSGDFKIGDRVSVAEEHIFLNGRKNFFYEGTIIDIKYFWHLSIEFDRRVKNINEDYMAYANEEYIAYNAKFGHYVNKRFVKLVRKILTVKEWKEKGIS